MKGSSHAMPDQSLRSSAPLVPPALLDPVAGYFSIRAE
jgi:hypothetical protein